ncbi:hypothetical protein RO3G_09232 [Rhizopus delemar RA 99-880]|uniref:Uncharacterized protein n=1 Tax=Rhizopus delemar (strain RA 99-880 / ATCC MYA-4621 / FGSC 9543 / NRRL 43880) TaxID=246409 RepID=I1C7U2_RHIO9|nr:hypothetical protein RO3G_09232 [Rhizopus delemar RA 99-880]|eukprot:EIE84522.1 hypothetical protein RO3G_09232 [Rhizopus delemar RA 99-880]
MVYREGQPLEPIERTYTDVSRRGRISRILVECNSDLWFLVTTHAQDRCADVLDVDVALMLRWGDSAKPFF